MSHFSNERVCQLVEHVGGEDVKPISELLSYGECVQALQALSDGGQDAYRYDIVNTNTGRFMSWILK